MEKNRTIHGGPWIKLFLIMRLSILLIFAFVMAAQAESFSQVSKVTLDLSKVKLGDVLNEIEDQTDYYFYFNLNIDDYSVDRVNVESQDIREVLSKMLPDMGLDYEIVDRYIVIKHADRITGRDGISAGSQQQSRAISGNVTNVNGEPLPGVTVVLKGTSRGTVTNTNGSYTLPDVPADAILIFSFIGMGTQEIPVAGKNTVNLVMEDDAIGVDEVVVIGYGTQSMALVTGSISSVDGNKISSLPVTNINQAISTFVPSVTIRGTASEQPGSTPTLRIRGESSINGGEPLVLLDGVPADMNTINPDDVESFTVLKDAASTAIYGARGSGGVILIKTKTGRKNERIRIAYSGHYSVKTPTILPEMIDSKTYVDGRAKAEIAAGISTNWNHPDILAALNDPDIINIPDPGRPTTHFVGTADTDWISEVVGNSNIQQHNISVDGGGEKGSYRVSTGYLDETAIYNYGDFGYQRFNSRINLTAAISDFINLGFNFSFVRSVNDQPVNGWDAEIQQVYFSHPNDPVKWDTGDWGANNDGNAVHDLVEGGHNILISNETILNFNGEINIAKGLTFNGVAAFEITHANREQDQRSILRYSVRPGVVIGSKYVPNQLIKTATDGMYKNYQGYFTYKTSFLDSHNLKLLTGGAFEDSYQDSFTARRQEYFSNDLLLSLDLGTGDQLASGSPTDWVIGSFFGRLNYDYRYKYLLEASFRYDGSSRFTSDYRWGFFPSVSAGWRLKKENFLAHANWLSDLKIRSSWGKVGNQSGIGLYDYISRLVVAGDYPMGSDYDRSKWVVQNALASPSRTWETIETTNAGLDFGFLGNKLTGSFEYYVKYNKDMLVPVDVPSIVGFDVPTYNAGELKTKGWEATLTWYDKIDKFKYGISVTLHDSKNKITRFDRSKELASGTQNIEGYPLNSYFGYKTAGYFQSKDEVDDWAFQHSLNAAGDVKYLNLDGDDRIGAGDVTYLGNPLPRYNFTVNLEANWKNIDFSATFEGIGKRNIPVPSVSRITYPVAWPRFKEHLDYWTEDNRDAMFPRLYNADNWNWWNSDRLIWNASYCRLKNLQIGYTLPAHLSGKMHVTSLRVYFNGRNLLTFDNYIPFMDPEITSVVQYPILKSFSVGLNLTL